LFSTTFTSPPLPKSISDAYLAGPGLPKVNANRLKSLPDSVARLQCHTFAANGNDLVHITAAIGVMPNLKWLALCDNKIK
jgi:Leucine-rich repeat (LRR) protein